MPKILSLSNLGEFGVNTDLAPSTLQAEFFTYGANFKLTNGKIESYNGSTKGPTSPVSDSFAQLLSFVSEGSNYYLLMGKTKVYRYDGSAWTDISPATALPTVNEFLWTAAVIGGIAVLNNPGCAPLYYYPSIAGGLCKYLQFTVAQTWLAKTYYANAIRAHKNFLFAIGTNEASTAFDYSYRWSHPADINGLPFTWDAADVSAIAGKSAIAGSGGKVIDGKSLRDAFCIYSQKAITILDYVGGDFTWQARPLSTQVGLLAQNCIAQTYDAHVLMCDSDIVINDGNQIRSVLDRVMRRRLSSTISTSYYMRSYAIANIRQNEVWVCIPEEGNTKPNLAIIYNWVTDKVYLRDLHANWTSMAYGPLNIDPTLWSTVVGSWELSDKAWSYSKTSPFSDGLVGVDSGDSSLHLIGLNDGTYDMGTVLERSPFAIKGEESTVTVVSIYPKIECTGPVKIEVGAREFSEASVRWQPPVTYNPNTMRKADMRSTGLLHSWRVSSIGNIPFKLKGLDIEYEINGRR